MNKCSLKSNKLFCVFVLFFITTLICFTFFNQNNSKTFLLDNLTITKNSIIGCTGLSLEIPKSFFVDNISVSYKSLDEIETEINKNEKIEESKKTINKEKYETKIFPEKRSVFYDNSLTIESSGYLIKKSIGNCFITYYCSCKNCCGVWANNRPIDENGKEIVLTASGQRAFEGVTIAVDKSIIPHGSIVFIDGFGLFTAQDVGGAIIGNHIDIYLENHDKAYQIGNKNVNVYIVS